jgi:hypothetical protein
MRAKKQILSITLIASMILVFLGRVFLTNLFCLATGQGYFIPQESTVFTFNALMMNSGSGEWWLYGEDKANYYALTDAEGYYVIDKTNTPENFSDLDKDSWGEDVVLMPLP